MFKQYFKIILRNWKKNKIYTVINIVGLAIAFSITLLISNHVITEWTMDKFHSNAGNIYRITNQYLESKEWESLTAYLIGPYAKQEIPGIVNYTRIMPSNSYGIKNNETEEYIPIPKSLFIDENFFQMFDFPIIQGKIDSTVLNWIIVTQNYAKQHFGDQNPIDKTVFIKDLDSEKDHGCVARIVAVIEDLPANSSIQSDIFIDSRVISKNRDILYWGCCSSYTYLQLASTADISVIERMIPQMIEKNNSYLKANEYRCQLQPLTDIYFHSNHLHPEAILRGQISLSLLLYGIILLILFLALGNYIMIKTAQINKNITRMGIQKCFGADNRTIRLQLSLEIGIHTLCALLLSFALAYVLHPYIIEILSPEHPYRFHLSFQKFAGFLLLVFFAMFLTGFVLHLYTHRRLNHNGLKQAIQPAPRYKDIKKILTIVQITIFSALLFCATAVSRQMNYMQHMDLGFNQENILYFYWPDNEFRYETLKQKLQHYPAILNASNGYPLPCYERAESISIPNQPEKTIKARIILGDADYIDTYQIQLQEGRCLKKYNYPIDLKEFARIRPNHIREAIVNRSLVKALQLEHPLETILNLWDHECPLKIVGVVDDFQYFPLYKYTEPAIIMYEFPQISSTMIVHYQTGEFQNVYRYIRTMFQEKFPNTLFKCEEYNFSELYGKDIAVVKLIILFALITILIGGMGIFAFSTFMVESKTREVALRKVNGATEWQIMQLFNQQFFARVLLACFIGLPVAYYASKEWLKGFAYKVEIHAGLFIFVFLTSVFVVLAITTWQTRKAARQNPIDTLKTE